MTWIAPQRALVRGAVLLLAFVVLGTGARLIWRQRMQRTSLLPRHENTIEARVTIQRPVEKVFGFYRDFENLPSFLGDVMAIEQSGPATSRWTIQGPWVFE